MNRLRRHFSPGVQPLQDLPSPGPSSPAQCSPDSAVAMSAAAISPLTAAFAAAATAATGVASGLVARTRRVTRGSPDGSTASATTPRPHGTATQSNSFLAEPSPLRRSSSLREVGL
jgi:hypothetical protein